MKRFKKYYFRQVCYLNECKVYISSLSKCLLRCVGKLPWTLCNISWFWPTFAEFLAPSRARRSWWSRILAIIFHLVNLLSLIFVAIFSVPMTIVATRDQCYISKLCLVCVSTRKLRFVFDDFVRVFGKKQVQISCVSHLSLKWRHQNRGKHFEPAL